ncbi:MAG: hypothetical protein FJW30_29770 [Acidobacteria bacterium]|nr:hypothetical protein [Acidobacteriota bacterium]
MSISLRAADYTSEDKSFTITVPDGWRVRTAPILGQTMTILEPASGGEERVIAGTGVAAATNIQELSQHAAALTGLLIPGATLSTQPRFTTSGSSPAAEQSYRGGGLSAWNGMTLTGEFYFSVLAIARGAREQALEPVGRAILRSARFHGLGRNSGAERMLVGRWLNTDNRSRRTGVRDTLNYISNWSVVFTPNGQFRSEKESWVDTNSDLNGGGNTNAAAVHTGAYRVYGSTLVADTVGLGKQLYSIEWYPNGAGVKLNGQLFTRQ